MNNLLVVLEKLAKNTDYRIDLNELLSDQPLEIKNAFLNGKENQIKKQFSDTISPDRDKVVKISLPLK